MNESPSCPQFGCGAVLPLGQQNFQLNGRGSIVFAVENLRSFNLSLAVAEVGAILRHRWQSESSVVGKQNRSTSVATIGANYT